MSNEHSPASHFVQTAAYLAAHGGNMFRAAQAAESSPRAFRETGAILKAAVASGSLSDPAWAGSLASYGWASDAFQASLRNISVFDRLLSDGVKRIPLRTRIGLVTSASTGSVVAEGAPKPVMSLALAGPELEASKASALIVITQEMLLAMVEGSLQLFRTEMEAGVVAATDGAFLTGLTTGAASQISAGATPANVLTDVKWLLDQINAKAASRVYLVADAATARALATMANADGSLAFPGVTPFGGELAGVPLLVSDEAPAATLSAIDASAIAAGVDVMTLRGSDQALIQMDTVPGSGEQAGVSMFQTNSRAILVERNFGFELVRAAGVAVVTGVAY